MTDPCPACGTWVCKVCGWKRPRASRFHLQWCGQSTSHIGSEMLSVRHRPGRDKDHREEFAILLAKGLTLAWPLEE